MLQDTVNFDTILLEVYFKTARSGGAGGQHVNKTETKIELYWNINASQAILHKQQFLLLDKLSSKVDKEGILRVVSSKTRSQLQNKEDAIDKFKALILASLEKAAPRIPTKIPKSIIRKRLDDKKKTSTIKQSRKKIDKRDVH